MIKRVIFFIACTVLIVQAQTYRITGYVFDGQTREALAGANVSIAETALGGMTDEQGFFTIEVSKPGVYTVNVSYVGYRPAKRPVKLLDERETVVFQLQPLILPGQTIVITETRAKSGETPVAFSNMSREEIENTYTASDVPMMLSTLPNTYSYSLTGDELGYSFLKIRGFDQKRIGVMINDIPLNDPEDHQVYWVDMPDLAESTQDIQVQRGVGSTVYGTSTFGGSVNILTNQLGGRKGISAQFLGGSFNTKKFAFKYNSGLVDNTYAFHARFSRITSDGFRENSGSELWSYFLSAARYDEKMITRLNIYGGQEITHPDWDGLYEEDMNKDRTMKYSTYANDIDNFSQPHFELINEWFINKEMTWKNSFYYIRGAGYYENLKNRKKLVDFGMQPFATYDPGLFGSDSLKYYETVGDSLLYRDAEGRYYVKRTDLVRQKWVKKNQYGWVSRFNVQVPDGALSMGFSSYLFDSDHFGKVIWAKNMPAEYDADRKYYAYNGDKKAATAFINFDYDYTKKIKIMSNLLYEYKWYEMQQQAVANFQGDKVNSYRVEYHFLSPRLGATYLFDKNWNMFVNLSYSQREPSDDDLYDTWQGPDDLGVPPLFAQSDTLRSGGTITGVRWSEPYVKPEEVMDLELGIHYSSPALALGLNLYRMDFRNEIVPFGTVDNDGRPIKGNAGSTIHQGVEFSFNAQPLKYIQFSGNFSYSQNYFRQFLYNEIDWETGQVAQTIDLSGNSIAGFPEMIGNVQITSEYRNLYAALMGQYVGKQYLDNTQNENRIIDPYFTLRLVLAYRIDWITSLPSMRFQLKINNLLDEEYETAGYYYYGNYYWPAAGRSIYAGVTVEF